jgi:hypothetical protein
MGPPHMGRHREPSRSRAACPPSQRRYRRRHHRRCEGPPEFQQQQGVPTHRSRGLAATRERSRPVLGVAGLKRATVKVEIGQTDYINARRIMRRWSRAQVAYADPTSRFPTAVNPRTAKVCVRRADSRTGLTTVRRVCRRRQLCPQGGLAGGFALANNGPEFASQLARALSLCHW